MSINTNNADDILLLPQYLYMHNLHLNLNLKNIDVVECSYL
jgi:hypothetical protein